MLRRITPCLAVFAVAACGSTPESEPTATTSQDLQASASAVSPGGSPGGSLGSAITGSAGCTRSRASAGASSLSKPIGSDAVAEYASGAKSSDSANNLGGGAIANPVVELVFWGSAWNAGTTNPSRQSVTNAFTTVMSSSYFDAMGQYGVSHVSFDKAVATTDYGLPDPNTSYQWSDVGFIVSMLVMKGAYGNANPNNVYLVMMPPGTTPPSGVCGSHSTEFFGGLNGLVVGWSAFGDLGSMIEDATHEIVESITDPDGGGWQMSRSFAASGWSEIGDACNGVADFIDDVLVQSYWSNTDRACIIPVAPPVITGFSPTSGSSGTVVTVTGKHLGGGAPVATFGGVRGTSEGATACPTDTVCRFVAPSSDTLSMNVSFYVQSNYSTVCLEDSEGQCIDFKYPCVGALVNGACLQCCAADPASYDCLPTNTTWGKVTEVWLGSSNCTGGQQPTVVRSDPPQCGPVGPGPTCSQTCTQTEYLECECPGSEVMGSNGYCETVSGGIAGGPTGTGGTGKIGPVQFE